jgi:PPOX class probable F420-dependent enzyme
MTAMPPLPTSEYVSLTTFRRTGEPVPTPVWAAADGADLVVWTRTDTGKVTRLRHTARVTVAPCEFRGKTTGDAVEGVAEIIDHAEWPRALAALRRDYGLRFQLGYLTGRVVQRLSRRTTDRNEIIRIHPA